MCHNPSNETTFFDVSSVSENGTIPPCLSDYLDELFSNVANKPKDKGTQGVLEIASGSLRFFPSVRGNPVKSRLHLKITLFKIMGQCCNRITGNVKERTQVRNVI